MRRVLTPQQYVAHQAKGKRPLTQIEAARHARAARRKYGNEPTDECDSRKEQRWTTDLRLLEAAGNITDLHIHPRFELIPTQRDADGKVVEHKCVYEADASYRTRGGEFVVLDVKSPATKRIPSYVIKRKLMLALFGIRVQQLL